MDVHTLPCYFPCSDPMHWPSYRYVRDVVLSQTGESWPGEAGTALAPTRPGRTANGPRARPYGAGAGPRAAGPFAARSADESQRAAADYRPWLFGRRTGTAQAPPPCWADLTHRPCLSGSARVCFRRPLRSLSGYAPSLHFLTDQTLRRFTGRTHKKRGINAPLAGWAHVMCRRWTESTSHAL